MFPIESLTFDVDPQRAWHAIYTRHQHEKKVAYILTVKGFETFLPLYSVTRRWKDRSKLLSLPLFPCYVFLKAGLERHLDIMTTPGIHALVSNAGQPAAIPPGEIDAIRRAVECGSRVEPHPFLKCGEWVRVKCGALEGIQGILVRKKNLFRLVLSVEMLGSAAAIEVDAFQIERLNGKPQLVGDIDSGATSTHAVRESLDLQTEIERQASFQRAVSLSPFDQSERQLRLCSDKASMGKFFTR